jgi:hypothetical protein
MMMMGILYSRKKGMLHRFHQPPPRFSICSSGHGAQTPAIRSIHTSFFGGNAFDVNFFIFPFDATSNAYLLHRWLVESAFVVYVCILPYFIASWKASCANHACRYIHYRFILDTNVRLRSTTRIFIMLSLTF